MMREIKGGQQKLVLFTPPFDAIELNSQMVLETISDDGSTAQIDQDSALYLEIERTINDAATVSSRSWPRVQGKQEACDRVSRICKWLIMLGDI